MNVLSSRVARQHLGFLSRARRWRSTSAETASANGKANESDKSSQRNGSIVGTVPYHTSYVLLRHPDPPSTYPSKIDSKFSPLYRELMLRAKPHGGLVNFWWGGEEARTWAEVEASKEETKTAAGGQDAVLSARDEHYPLTFFGAPSPSHAWCARTVSLPSVHRGSSNVTRLFDEKSSSAHDGDPERGSALLLVCTHGARDCRCGDKGSALARALKAELTARRRQSGSVEDRDESVFFGDVWKRIRVGEIAHVGGHKHAANLLVFPSGDWLGNLTLAHASLILDAVAARLREVDARVAEERLQDGPDPSTSQDALEPLAPLIADAALWRGRMGLTKEEQERLLERHVRSRTES